MSTLDKELEREILEQAARDEAVRTPKGSRIEADGTASIETLKKKAIDMSEEGLILLWGGWSERVEDEPVRLLGIMPKGRRRLAQLRSAVQDRNEH